MQYRLRFHGRQRGAIGIFYDVEHEVDAANEAEAIDLTMEKYEPCPGGQWGSEIKVTMLGEPDDGS